MPSTRLRVSHGGRGSRPAKNMLYSASRRFNSASSTFSSRSISGDSSGTTRSLCHRAPPGHDAGQPLIDVIPGKPGCSATDCARRAAPGCSCFGPVNADQDPPRMLRRRLHIVGAVNQQDGNPQQRGGGRWTDAGDVEAATLLGHPERTSNHADEGGRAARARWRSSADRRTLLRRPRRPHARCRPHPESPRRRRASCRSTRTGPWRQRVDDAFQIAFLIEAVRARRRRRTDRARGYRRRRRRSRCCVRCSMTPTALERLSGDAVQVRRRLPRRSARAPHTASLAASDLVAGELALDTCRRHAVYRARRGAGCSSAARGDRRAPTVKSQRQDEQHDAGRRTPMPSSHTHVR